MGDTMYPELSHREVAVLARGSTWAAVYNPAGTVAHPHKFRSKATRNPLVNRLKVTFGRRVHLVHRLDRQVSGISLVAFDPQTCSAMHSALVGPSAIKTYYAFCRGNGTSFRERGPFILDRPLRDRSNRNETLRNQMKNASTEATVLWGGDGPPCCLVRAQPRTGRYHQIRRHLRNVSLPVIGDDYARKQVREEWDRCGIRLPDRVLLHLHRISLPATELTPPIDVSCPLPPELIGLVRRAFPDWIPAAEVALPELFAPPPPNLGYQRQAGMSPQGRQAVEDDAMDHDEAEA